MKKTLCALLSLVVLSGCAAAVVGGAAGAAAGYVWVNGILKDSLPASLPRVETATKAAFEELGLVAVNSLADKLKAKITARMADGTKVRVQLKAIDFESTSIHIRVGALGDKAISEQVMRHIKKHL